MGRNRNTSANAGSVPLRGLLIVDRERIQPADVILTTGLKGGFATAIRMATWSKFSHAAICLDPPWFMESAEYGVVAFKIHRLIIRDSAHVKILRLRDLTLLEQKTGSIVAFLRKQVSREYAMRDALVSLVDSVAATEDGRFFCSQLVASAFRQAGVALFEPDKDPGKVTPEDLSTSPFFEDVTDKCLRLATIPELRLSRGYLDGSFTPASAETEASILHKIMKELKPTLDRFELKAAAFADLFELIAKGIQDNARWLPPLDAKVADIIEASGLVSMARKHMPPEADPTLGGIEILCSLPEKLKTEDRLKLAIELYVSKDAAKAFDELFAEKRKNFERIVKEGLTLTALITHTEDRYRSLNVLLVCNMEEYWVNFRMLNGLKGVVDALKTEREMLEKRLAMLKSPDRSEGTSASN